MTQAQADHIARALRFASNAEATLKNELALTKATIELARVLWVEDSLFNRDRFLRIAGISTPEA